MADGNFVTEVQLEEFMGLTFDATSVPTSTQVGNLLAEAELEVIHEISEYHEEENITRWLPPIYLNNDGDWGQTNGSNTIFFTRHTPVADYDADGSVDDTGDITVALFNEGADTWAEGESVSTLVSRRGKITLTSAPDNDERVYVTYASYVSGSVPNNLLLEKAIKIKAAIRVIGTKAAPHSVYPGYSMGGVGMQHPSVASSSKVQIESYERLYKRAIAKLRRKQGVSA